MKLQIPPPQIITIISQCNHVMFVWLSAWGTRQVRGFRFLSSSGKHQLMTSTLYTKNIRLLQGIIISANEKLFLQVISISARNSYLLEKYLLVTWNQRMHFMNGPSISTSADAPMMCWTDGQLPHGGANTHEIFFVELFVCVDNDILSGEKYSYN